MATLFVEIPGATVALEASAGWYITGGFGKELAEQQSVTNMLMARRRRNFNHTRHRSLMTQTMNNVNINATSDIRDILTGFSAGDFPVAAVRSGHVATCLTKIRK